MAPNFTMASPLLAEFVGTFMLVFTVGCNVLGKTSSDWAPTSIACTLMVMIYGFAGVSGGHLNPSVTLAHFFTKKIGWQKAGAYVVMQLLAGAVASFAYKNIFLSEAELVPGPTEGHTWWQACLVEALYTAMLSLVVLCVTCKRNNPEHQPNQFYGLAIGFVVIAGGYGAGKISGGAFNPAVSFGLGAFHQIRHSLVYMVYQVCGSALAALLFRVLRPEEFSTALSVDTYEPSLATRIISEFTGTFFLVLTVGLNVMGQSSAVAWSAAASLMSMIYALGDISGAHFNPAVTLAVVLARKGGVSMPELPFYWLAQVAAGGAASLLYVMLYSGATVALGPKAPFSDQAAYIMEFTFTLILCLTVLSVACVKGIATPLARNHYFGLAIGSAVTAGGFAAGGVSGGCLNPAVTLGIGLTNMGNDGTDHAGYMLTYCLAQLFAGIGAALLFFSTHTREYSPKTDNRRLFTAQF